MTQYNGSQPATSEGNYPAYGAQGVSRGPSSASSAGYAGQGASATTPTTPFPMPSIPAGVATGAVAGAGGAAALGAPYSKQREAYGDRFRVQNEGGSGSGGQPMSPTGTSGSGGPVTVHEDGGALDDNAGGEIPPT
jgi:hypothetical protein